MLPGLIRYTNDGWHLDRSGERMALNSSDESQRFLWNGTWVVRSDGRVFVRMHLRECCNTSRAIHATLSDTLCVHIKIAAAFSMGHMLDKCATLCRVTD